MKRNVTKYVIAWSALIALAACSAPGGPPSVPSSATSSRERAPLGGRGILQTFVGIGDSLTAGYQAGGFLGATNVPNPLSPGTIVRPGQENGWWADVDEQASGLPIPTAIAREYDPAISPLPLIAGPGLNNQLVPSSGGLAPIGELKSGDTCADNGGFNAAGFLLSGNKRTRMNPNATTIRDVGVPGITLHEANVLFAPQTNTCEPIPGVPGLLSAVTQGESSVFWPVLGNFFGMGYNLSEAKAAASLHPTLATVWLGANDVLKFMGSGGKFVGGDNTVGQVQADIIKTVRTEQYAGAKVVVADLPNVLKAAYFMQINPNPTSKACKIQTYVYCLMVGLGFPGATAGQIATELGTQFHLLTPNGCKSGSVKEPCGYLTLPGALGTLSYFLSTNKLPNLDCAGANFGPPCSAGSGLGGYYITPAFASQIQSLNNVVNDGIHQGAGATGVPVVPIEQIFDGIASGNPNNPYFKEAVSINPGVCCTLVYNGGFLSFDGLHPSNTGYALIASVFIDTINGAYHTSIPQIDVVAAYRGTRCANKHYCFPDVYAPQVIHDAQLVRTGPRSMKIQYLVPR